MSAFFLLRKSFSCPPGNAASGDDREHPECKDCPCQESPCSVTCADQIIYEQAVYRVRDYRDECPAFPHLRLAFLYFLRISHAAMMARAIQGNISSPILADGKTPRETCWLAHHSGLSLPRSCCFRRRSPTGYPCGRQSIRLAPRGFP